MTPIDRVSALESLLARIKKNAAQPRPARATRASTPAKQPVAHVRAGAPATLDTTPPPSTLDPAQLRSEPPEEPTLVRQQMAPDLEQLARDAQSDDAVLEVEFDEIEFVDEGTLEAGKTPPPPRAQTRPPGANSKMRVMPSNSPLASMAREAARADAERVSARAATDRAALDRASAERIAKEQAEVDRRHAEEEREREEAERFERELEEAERRKAAEKTAAAAEAARVAREQQDRIEAARIAREQAEREERERAEREKAEREGAAQRAREQDQRDQAERERAEREQIARAKEEADRRARELADRAREDAERVARAEREKAEREKAEREEAERVTREMEEPQQAITIPGEPDTTMRTPSAPEQSGVKHAPISSRQPRADDYPAGDDGFGELLDDDQPPESGEVASQRKPTIHDEPTMVAAALAGWGDEEEDEPNRRPTTPQDEPPFADVSHSSRKLPTGEDATMLHSRADLRRPEPPPPAIVNRPGDPRAEVVRRSAPAGEPAAFVGELRATRPTSFGDLLDASLSLGLDDDPSRPTQ